MPNEELLTKKNVGCVDLVKLVFALESQGAKYKINDDGSVTVYEPNSIFMHDSGSHKLSGLIYNAFVEYGEIVFECNRHNTHPYPDAWE